MPLSRALPRNGETAREVWSESTGAAAGVGIITFLLVSPAVLVAGALFLVASTGTTGGPEWTGLQATAGDSGPTPRFDLAVR